MLHGSILLNLDSEEDGTLTVGCAGSTDTWIRVRRPRGPLDERSSTLSVTVGGGLGGHSGMNIAQGRSNAVKVLGRALEGGAGHGAVPAGVDGRRQEPERHPPRCGGGRVRAGVARRGVQAPSGAPRP